MLTRRIFLAAALFCAVSITNFGQAQFAGVYSGIIYITVGSNPESSAGAILISVNNAGEISASAGMSGRVDASGAVAWNTPNPLYFTTGQIVGGLISATGSTVENGLTIVTRLAASNKSAIAPPNSDPIVDSLSWVNPTPLGGTLQAVIYQNNQFVAIGAGGAAAISADGSNWQVQSTASRFMMNGLTFGKGLYVAVGLNEMIETSPDTLNWTLRSTPSGFKFDLSAIAFGNNRFLAVGGVGTSYYSDDGIVWQPRASGISYVDVKFLNGKFIIFGYTPGGNASTYTSTDAATWSTASTVGPILPIRGISYGNGKYLLGGTTTDGKFRTYQSTDAATWTANTNIIADGVTNSMVLKNLAFNDGHFIGFDFPGISYTSADGIVWKRGGSVSRGIKDLAFGGGHHVAVGDIIASSTNAVVWDEHATRKHLPHFNKVSGNLAKLSIVGQGGLLTMSANGFLGGTVGGSGVTNDLLASYPSTTTLTDPIVGEGGFFRVSGNDYIIDGHPRLNGFFNSFPSLYLFGEGGALYVTKTVNIFTNSLFQDVITNIVRIPTGTTAEFLGEADLYSGTYLFGRGGTIVRTTNSFYTNWVVLSSGTTADLYAGTKSGNGQAAAVIVGDQGTILTSTNGVAWTKRASGTTDKLIAVTYQEISVFATSRVYIAMGEGGTVVLSYDNGVTWSVTSNNFGRKIRSMITLANSPGSDLMAVGEYGLLVRSSDLTNWTSTDIFGAGFSSAVYGNGRWAVAGPYYCLTSQDGVRWDFHSFKYSGSAALGYGGGKFVALVQGGKILTSPDAINWVDTYSAPLGQNPALNSVAYGAGRWVATGFGTIFISADAISWTRASVPATGAYTGVRYANGLWIAIGQSGLNAYSTDGINWTVGSTGLNDNRRSVTFGKSLWVGVGDSGRVSTSTNGINWVAHNQDASFQLIDVKFAGDRFVALGSAGNTNLVLISTNGTNWISIGLPVQPILRGLAAANGSVLFFGDDGTILQSSYPVNGLPGISVTPATNLVAKAGQIVTFKATVSGTGPFAYQWSRNGTPLSDNSRITGSTASSLSVTLSAEEDGGDYTVEVSNAVGSRVSFPVNLTVIAPPTFLTQPVSQTVLAGGTVTISTSTKSAGVTYQWLKNGAAIVGATNATLTLSKIAGTDAGAYSVIASNVNGSRASATATLSISAPPTYIADPSFLGSSLPFTNLAGFQNGIWAIQTLPNGKRLIGGTFKLTAGTASYTSFARLNSDGSLDTSFTNITLTPNLSLRPAVHAILPLPDGRILLGADATSTTTKGLVLLEPNGATDAPPALVFGTSGDTTHIDSLALQADGKIVMSGYFTLNGLNHFGRLNPNLTLDASFGSATPRLLSAESYSLGIQADQKLVFAGAGISRALTNGLKDQAFQQLVSGTVESTAILSDGRIAIGGQFTIGSHTNFAVLMPDGTADDTIKANPPSIVYSITLLPDDSVVAAGVFTSINTVTNGQVALIRKDGSVDAAFKADLGISGVPYSVSSDPGGAILIGGSFKSFNGAPATNLVRVVAKAAGVALTIINQPQPVSADIGDTISLNVAATGGSPLNFQWRKNGALIPGATQSSLVLASVTTNDVGNYTVSVSDPSGAVSSPPVPVTVAGIKPPPIQTGGGFSDWAATNNLPANARGPGDDPDGDHIPNIFEYYFGTNPASSSSGATVAGFSLSSGGHNYPAIVFVRSKSATGVNADVQVSSSVNFSDALGSVQDSAVDLGNGLERVTIRSSADDRAHPVQFLRLRLSIAP